MTDYRQRLDGALDIEQDASERLDAIVAIANRYADMQAEAVQQDRGAWLTAAVASVAAQFCQTAAFRVLSNCGIRDQTARDREVAAAILGGLEEAILYAAGGVRIR